MITIPERPITFARNQCSAWAGIRIDLIRSEEGTTLLDFSAPGQLLVRSDAGADLYRSDCLDLAIIGLVGEEITAALGDTEDVELVEPNYWSVRRQGKS